MMGESGVVSIKVMTNKSTGEPAGFGFINFDSDSTTPSSPPSGGPGGPLSAATSAGPDYSAYHQYYQQFAQ